MEFPAEASAAEAQATDESMAIDTNPTPEQQLSTEQQLQPQPVEAHEGMQPDGQGDSGIMPVQMDAGFISAPAGLPPLQSPQDSQGDAEIAKFKPIDLEQLSPKSRQRVLRNRQAATRSKAKKKQQFTTLKDKKTAVEAELQHLENQFAGAQQRIAHLQVENQGLMQSCKCPKESEQLLRVKGRKKSLHLFQPSQG